MKSVTRYSLLAIAALATWTAHAAEPNRLGGLRQLPLTAWEKVDSAPGAVWCPLVAKPPVLDGKLDDDCWKVAGKVDGFLKCDDNIPVDIPASLPSEVRICRDKTNFYLAWKRMGEPAEEGAKRFNPDKRYGFAYQDAFSTTIFQPPGSTNWIRLQLNNNGNATLNSQQEGEKYKGTQQVFVAPIEGGSITEIAIPFSNPGLSVPVDGQWWRFQLGRVDNSEWTSWPNTRGLFEQPTRFGYLYFGDEAAFRKAQVPVQPKFELYGERYTYDRDDPVTQFIASLSGVPVAGRTIRFHLNRLDGNRANTVAEQTSTELTQTKAAAPLLLDGLPAGHYEMVGTMLQGGKPVAGAPEGHWTFSIVDRKAPVMAFPPAGVPISVHAQDMVPNLAWPVTLGVPLPRYAVQDVAELALFENGQRIPAQITARNYWTPMSNSANPPDAKYSGGLRWVGLSFTARYDGTAPRQYVLKKVAAGDAAPASPLAVTENEKSIEVVTGPLRLAINKQDYNGIAGAWLDLNKDGKFDEVNERMAGGQGGGASLVDQSLTSFRSTGAADPKHPTVVTVEEQGPQRVVIAAKGWYHDANGNPLCIYHTRYIAYAGQPWVRVLHRSIVTFDTRKNKLADLAYTVPVAFTGYYYVSGDKGQYIDARLYDEKKVASISLHQDRDAHFRVLREAPGPDAKLDVQQEGRRAPGEAGVFTRDYRGVSVVLKDFWQKFPKELELTKQGVTLHFWPRHGYDTFSEEEELDRPNYHKLRFAHEGKFMELQLPKKYADYAARLQTEEYVNLAEGVNPGMGANGQGIAVSNEFAIDFRSTRLPNVTPDLLQTNPSAFVDPVYACATGVLGPITAENDAKYPDEERLINQGMLSHTHFFERCDSWGMWNNKDLNSFSLPAMNYPNTHRLWQNAHAQQPEVAWRSYFRSGNPEWLSWARAYSDHFMNVDTCNYDDPDNMMCGTTPDGTQLMGCFVHIAGGCYHCKGYIHWASELNVATHFTCPTSYLLNHLMDGDYAALDTYHLWYSGLHRMALAIGGSRDVNCTMAHLVPAYQYFGDPQLLLYIHRDGKSLLEVPFKNHESGHYHPLWAERYYDLTRDDNMRKCLEQASADGMNYPGFNSLAYRITGDEKYLKLMFNEVIADSRGIYLNPADPLDGFTTVTPESHDQFFVMGLPTYLAQLDAAKLPLQVLPPAKPSAAKAIMPDTVTPLAPLENYLQAPADQKTPVTLVFTGKTETFNDYTGSHIAVTMMTVTDAAGHVVLETSIGAAMQRTHASVTIDPQKNPGPWRVFTGQPVDFRFQGAASLQQADTLGGLEPA